jgi:hypothetical protein
MPDSRRWSSVAPRPDVQGRSDRTGEKATAENAEIAEQLILRVLGDLCGCFPVSRWAQGYFLLSEMPICDVARFACTSNTCSMFTYQCTPHGAM